MWGAGGRRPTWAQPRSMAATACPALLLHRLQLGQHGHCRTPKLSPLPEMCLGGVGAAALLPHPWGGDRGSSVSSAPWLSPRHILVIQIRSRHKGGGPAPNKEPPGAARGTRPPQMNANASIPWEQLLWDNTEQHCERVAALIRKPPGMPSAPQLEELGAGADPPVIPTTRVGSRGSYSSFCTHTLASILKLPHPLVADAGDAATTTTTQCASVGTRRAQLWAQTHTQLPTVQVLNL